MKIRKFLLFVLLLSCSIFTANAQSQFTMKLSAKPETCENNGKITVDIFNTQSGAVLSIDLFDKTGTALLINVSNQTAEGNSFSYTFDARSHGTYTVKIKEEIGGRVANQEEGTVTIENKMEELAFNAVIEDVCEGLKITADVTAGNPVEYRLLQGSNVVISWQASNVLNLKMPFADGIYALQVKDECGQIRLKELTLKQPEQPDYCVARKNAARLGFKLLNDCNHFIHREQLYFKPGSHKFPSYRYPMNVKIEVENPVNPGNPTIIQETWTKAYAKTYRNIPYYEGKTYNYKITFTDACGKKFVQEDIISTKEPSFGISQEEGTCLRNFLSLHSFYYIAAPLKVTILEAPAGFVASEYNSHFTGENTSAAFTEPLGAYSTIELKSDTKTIPDGIYKIQIESCGKTIIREKKVENTSKFKVDMYRNKYGCGEDNAALKLWIATNKTYHKADDIGSIKITAAPAQFIAQYGALPYDISGNIFEGRLFMNSLPAGDYAVDVRGSCSNVLLTKSFALKKRIFNADVEVKQKCSSFDIKVTAYSNLYKEQFYLQKYYEEQGKWGHPSNSNNLYTEGELLNVKNAEKIGGAENSGPGSGSGALNTFERSRINLTGFGRYRVLFTYNAWGNGIPEEVCLGKVIKEFTISDPEIEINDYNVFQCRVNGKIKSSLFVDASGIEPLKYKIIKKDGRPVSEYTVKDKGVFEDLDTGLYLIEITDDCGNTRNVEFSTINEKLPKIVPYNLCENQNGHLYLSGAGFLKIKWFKDGADTGITGREYKFMPFNASNVKGVYSVKFYYPDFTHELCSKTIALDLTSVTGNVEAGSGKTADICAGVPFINLFDYIEGDYNNWGVWSDSADTGALSNDVVDIAKLMKVSNGQGGTYSFKYHVNGYCSGSDETTVTLNLLPEAAIAGTPDNVCMLDEFTLTGSGTPHPEKPWESSNESAVLIDKNGKVRVAGTADQPVTITYQTDRGCTVSQNITINALPAVPEYTVNPENKCGAKGSIRVTKQAGCEYSIDGNTYGSNTYFSNLDAGLYTVYVRNGNGCESAATAVVQMDSDCDGIGDNDDLDDDNDGILDTDEDSCGVNLVQNPSFEAQNFLDGSVGAVWAPYGTYFGQNLNSDQLAGWSYTTNCDGWSDKDNSMAAAAHGHQYMDVLGKDSRSTNPAGGTNTLYQVIAVEAGKTYTFSFYWGEDMGNLKPPYLGETNLTASVINNVNQAVIKTQNLREMAEGSAGGIRGPKHWNFYTTTFKAVSNSIKIAFRAAASGPELGTGAALDMVTVRAVCDTDGDGIPNRLDLDSDGDGCPDALEGGEHVKEQLLSGDRIKGDVDADGVPVLVSSDGEQGQSAGYSQDSGLNYCVDSDGDGYPDVEDLDDDNDGILDTDEKDCSNTVLPAGKPALEYSSVSNAENILDDDDVSNIRLTSYSDYVVLRLPEVFPQGAVIRLKGWGNNSFDNAVVYVSENKVTPDAVIGNSDWQHVDFGTAGGKTADVSLVRKAEYILIRKQKDDSNPLQLYDVSYERTVITICNDKDTDGDGIPNRLDLDSDSDGCPDALEGGDNVKSTRVNEGRIKGNVDADGVPVLVSRDGVQGQSAGGSQIKAAAQLIEPLQVNSPCEGNPVIFKFMPDVEGAGWKYKLQKKEGQRWKNKKEGDIAENKETVVVTLTDAASIENSGEYRIYISNVNNSCIELYSEIFLRVHPIPVFKLHSENAQCHDGSSEITVTITSGADTYDIYLYLNGKEVDKILNKKVTNTAGKVHVFRVFTSGKYSVKVFNKGADAFNRCDSGCKD